MNTLFFLLTTACFALPITMSEMILIGVMMIMMMIFSMLCLL